MKAIDALQYSWRKNGAWSLGIARWLRWSRPLSTDVIIEPACAGRLSVK